MEVFKIWGTVELRGAEIVKKQLAELVTKSKDLGVALAQLEVKVRTLETGVNRFGTVIASVANHTRNFTQNVSQTGQTLTTANTAIVGISNNFHNLNNTMNTTNRTTNTTNQTFNTTNNTIHNTTIQIAQLENATDRASRSMQNGSNRLREFGENARDVGKDLATKITLPIVALGGIASKLGIDFEYALSSIKAVSGATVEEMEAIKNQAIELGKKTKYSAIEVAKGQEELIKAGVKLSDVFAGATEGALNLATAGELELADAAEIASTALNAFSKDALTVTKAADILAGAANASATSVGQMKYGLSMSAAVASGVGLNFKETSTALAMFAQNGLKGSDAGTSLKTMLLNLNPTTKDAIENFRKFNLVTSDGKSKFYDLAGKIKPMKEIAQILQDAMKNFNDMDRQTGLKEMFGTDAIRAANILYKEGAKGYEAMLTAMEKVTALEVAETRMDNLRGSIERMMGAIETLGISIGTMLLPYIKPVVTWIEQMTDKINAIDPKITLLGIGIAGIIAILPILIIIFGQLVIAFSALAPILATIAGLFTGVGATITPVILIFSALVAIVVSSLNTFQDENIKVQRVLSEIWAEITKAGNEVFTVFKKVMQDVMKALEPLMPTWEKIQEIIAKTISEILVAIQPFVSICIKLAEVVIVNLIKALGVLLVNAIDIGGKLLAGFIPVFKNISKILIEFADFVSNVFTMKWSDAWTNVKNIFQNILSAILQIFRIFATGLSQAWNLLLPMLVNTANTAWEKIVEGTKNLIVGFNGLIGFLKDSFVRGWSDSFEMVSGIFKRIFDGIVQYGKTSINGMIRIINGFLNGLNVIKMPDWIPTVGGRGFAIPKIPYLAKGGDIVEAGRVIVGERGAEMLDIPKGARVTPLNGKPMENQKTNSGVIITIQNMSVADGKDFVSRVSKELERVRNRGVFV